MTLLTGSQHSIHWFISLHQRVFTRAHSPPPSLPSDLFFFCWTPMHLYILYFPWYHLLFELLINDVGLIKGAEPFVIAPKSNRRPKPWQYPLNPEATRGIRPLFESLRKAGVIVPCSNSPVHIPILPVKEIRDKGQPDEGRVVRDLRAINAAVHARAPLVSNPRILAQMSFLSFFLLRNSAPLRLSP